MQRPGFAPGAGRRASLASVHDFTGSDGVAPHGSLSHRPDGTLYGTTQKGGAFPGLVGRGGTVFRVEPDGTGFALLHSFKETDGYEPAADLIQGFDGSLYGTTTGGVIAGVIFRVGTVPLVAPSSASATLGEKAVSKPRIEIRRSGGRLPAAVRAAFVSATLAAAS